MSTLLVRHGITRTVILTRRYAIKVPSLRGGSTGGVRGRLQAFAWGVLANQAEYQWHEYEPWAGKVAPVLRSWLWGLVQVYPRCVALTEREWGTLQFPRLDPDPGDHKPDNYGWLGGRIVRIDYDMR
ncbi:hypothetical protein [Phytohabitans houttuyneae]|uniref:Uncharacterized protein n=1 Tax=Phytohabitans houttuyneae TaxID=1076126 RepID=A0A6V8KCM6_9ACTN|nr:hypothetical protein [Phytohabitans houttuyneae]GFJ79467.1 hypothetical protein Phou_036470 [Phytohabitans houttuyneae]